MKNRIYQISLNTKQSQRFTRNNRIIRAFSILILLLIFGMTTFVDVRISLAVVIPIALLLNIWQRQRILDNYLAIRKIWGQERFRQRDLAALQKKYADNQSAGIDDQSWQDLNLDQFYQQLDRTFTAPGETILYRQLRQPQKDLHILQERADLISLLLKDCGLREKLLSIFIDCGRSGSRHFSELLTEKSEIRSPRITTWLPLFSGLSLIMLAGFLILRQDLFLYGICAALGINMILHYYCAGYYTCQPSAVRYAQKIVRTLALAGELQHDKFADYAQQAQKTSHALRIFAGRKIYSAANGEGIINFIFKIANIYFLAESVSYFRVIGEIKKQRMALQTASDLVGNLDALLSVASFRSTLEKACQPQLSADRKILQAVNLYHPLLPDCVPNDLKIDLSSSAGLLISGSNMAGKSTFLRTIGLNCVLAQTFYFCAADSFYAPFNRIFTSLGRSDSLLNGKSLFYAEAERLLQLIKRAAESGDGIFLIDEILTGTNTSERIAAARAVIKFLDRRGMLFITTHDQELILQHDSRLTDSYFEDYMDENGKISFDYKLKNGRPTSTNALKILKELGYPAEILEDL